jgi:hypothetical protein
MSDVTTTPFNLSPPTQEQLQTLEAGTEPRRATRSFSSTERKRRFAAFSSPRSGRGLYVPPVRPAPLPGRLQVRKRHRLAEFHRTVCRRVSA